MPELPDLHVFAENLKKRILNITIASVNIYDTRKIATPDYFNQKIAGTCVKDIARDGKELYFMLANDNCFSVHLMLGGQFFLGDQSEADKVKGRLMGLVFEDSRVFVIADVMKLCMIRLNLKPSRAPDAMSQKFTYKYFSSAIKRSMYRNIKALLIDQHFVKGIGNAYADEILWKANISPESFSGKIPDDKLKELYDAIPLVFNDAIANIKKIAPDIISGEERSFLRVHNRNKEFTDEGEKILIKTIADKSTYFTEKQVKYM